MTGRPLVGIGYRREVASEILAHSSSIDCLELLVEHFLPLTPARRRELDRLAEEFALILHGVSLSPGSVEPPGEPYWAGVSELIDYVEAPYLGEHASFSRGGGYDLWHLSPLWRTERSLEVLVDNLGEAQERLGVPVALETITEPFEVPGAELQWDEFLVEATRRSGAQLLIDVTNLWINRENQISGGPDLFGCLREAQWAQFHIVGAGVEEDGFLVDNHEAPVSPALLQAYAGAVAITPAPYTILERDGRLGEFDEVLGDLERLRQVLADAQPVLG
jgi:uncharacterized protein (UPF0276 family)